MMVMDLMDRLFRLRKDPGLFHNELVIKIKVQMQVSVVYVIVTPNVNVMADCEFIQIIK